VRRDTLRYRVKSPLPALLLAVLCLLPPAFAQERHNSLAINERLTEAGPYYFIAYGDSTNAFARAGLLAEAMGLELSYDNAAKTLTFRGNGITARMKATSDVAAGLVKRPGMLEANGDDIPSPMAIIVGGVSYVPIVPIAKAFNCDYGWHGQYRLITVNLPRPDRSEPAHPQATSPSRPSDEPTLAQEGPVLPPFRIGVHDGFTRVAVDMGDVTEYSVAVNDRTLLVTFAAGSAPEHFEKRDGGRLDSVYYARVGGRPALVVQTLYDLSASSKGFRIGRTESNTLYMDFAPQLSGPAVARLANDPLLEPNVLAEVGQHAEPLAIAPAPPAARPTVVLDAGHGGKFAGARNGSWAEEDIVLGVTLLLKELLESRGVDVILTRNSDAHLSEDYRGDLSARSAFATPERNLFVSIHANSFGRPDVQGIETFVFGEPLNARLIEQAIRENGGGDDRLGRQLTNEAIKVANETAGQILRETQLNYSRRLAHSVQQNLVEATGAVDRGVKQNVLHVLRFARTPAILVELGFVSNPVEGRKLASASYQETLAKALARGILEFLETGGTLASR
jgi:N-acetylmuramoyl-L-alanine amidase